MRYKSNTKLMMMLHTEQGHGLGVSYNRRSKLEQPSY